MLSWETIEVVFLRRYFRAFGAWYFTMRTFLLSLLQKISLLMHSWKILAIDLSEEGGWQETMKMNEWKGLRIFFYIMTPLKKTEIIYSGSPQSVFSRPHISLWGTFIERIWTEVKNLPPKNLEVSMQNYGEQHVCRGLSNFGLVKKKIKLKIVFTPNYRPLFKNYLS